MTSWIVNEICKTEDLIWGITLDYQNIYFTTGKSIVWTVNQFELNTQPNRLLNELGSEFRGLFWSEKQNTLYVCDWMRNRILMYSIESKKLSTLVGHAALYQASIECSLFYPSSIAMDPQGNMYITESHRIQKINVEEQTLEIIAGSKAYGRSGSEEQDAKNGKFKLPSGIAVDNQGTIFFCDSLNRCIRQIKNGVLSTVAGIPGKKGFLDGPTSEAVFSDPYSVIIKPDGNLLICDHDDHHIRTIHLKHKQVTSSTVPNIHYVGNIAMDKTGTMFVGSLDTLLRVEATWKWERLFWISFFKTDAKCPMSWLPREILVIIIQLCRPRKQI